MNIRYAYAALAALAIGAVLVTVGCSPRPATVVQAAPAVVAAPAAAAPVVAPPATVVVAPAPAAHSGAGDMLMGGMMGYMLGRSSATPSHAPAPVQHTTINKTVVKQTVVTAPPRPAATVVRSSPTISTRTYSGASSFRAAPSFSRR